MSVALESPFRLGELAELLRSGPRGTLAIVVCDSMAQARGMIARLRERLPMEFVEVSCGQHQRTLLDVLETHALQPGDVLCLTDLQRAADGMWRSLDLQRELLVDYHVSTVCWVTRIAQRDLALRAPNFYAFRTLLLDVTASIAPDPSRYLQDVREATATIDIRGLQVGRGRVARFPVEQWYLGLYTASDPSAGEPASGERIRDGDQESTRGPTPPSSQLTPLEHLLIHQRLLIMGPPGCGKTTFLRWVARTLSQACLGQKPDVAEHRLGLSEALFPVLLRVAELDAYLTNRPDGSPADESADWLPRHLAWQSEMNRWGLDYEFFQDRLCKDGCTVMLDGLDELADVAARERMIDLVEKAADAYQRTRFIITSRPLALSDKVRLANCKYAYVEPLSDGVVREFFRRWCAAVYPDASEAARTHAEELLKAVSVRPELRVMARNPLMLTALVVVHWNERRLPEQRGELYEAILTWLSRSREQRPGRGSPKQCLCLLQELAIEMHDHPAGRQVQVPRRWAAAAIANQLYMEDDRKQLLAAEQFLIQEELDSGILVSHGSEKIQFRHLAFQEYLAARALAGLLDRERNQRLLANDKLYRPEWREVFLLLAGILFYHGREALDRLFASVLDRLSPETPLAVRARAAGLLGAAVRELAVSSYRPGDTRYDRLMDDVLGVFRAESCVPIYDAIEAAEALGQAGDPRFAERDSESLWVAVPAGSFWMGAQKTDPEKRNYDPDASDNEAPVRRLDLPGYFIGRYPVTVAQYRMFVENGGYEDPTWWTAGSWKLFGGPEEWEIQLQHPTRPVTGISWYEAQAYCRWAGCRLPTEAQWERAARGDQEGRYPWGNDPPDETRMNYGHKVGCPTPVGIYARGLSPTGIADMAGNVREWCDNWHLPHVSKDTSNKTPEVDPPHSGRAVRGGSWFQDAHQCRIPFRVRIDPKTRGSDIGFRTVRVPTGGMSG